MTIKQAELERLRQLNQQMEEPDDRQRALRADLLERFREGASIEPGHWALEVREMNPRPLSREALIAVLGARETERLHQLMPPRKSISLRVIPSLRGRAR